MFSITGFWLLVITLSMVVGVCFAHPYIKKITNLYWFWLIIGILLLIWQLKYRFLQDFSELMDKIKNKDYLDSRIFSKGLLLDLCPFCSFTLAIALIIDPSRKIASIISYFGIFGGLITYLGGFTQIENDPTVDASWNPEWLFKGFSPNPMYFAIHFIQLFFCPWVLINKKSHISKDYLGAFLFITSYFSYVIIMVNIYGVTMNATGLVPFDWEYGEYANVASILHLSFPMVCIVGFLGVTIFILLMVFIFNIIQIKCEKYNNTFSLKEFFIPNFKKYN